MVEAAGGEPDPPESETAYDDAVAWSEAAATLHGYKVLIAPTSGDFVGTFVSRSIGNYAVVSMQYTAHVGSRSEVDIDPKAPRRWWVSLIVRGTSTITQDGRTCEIAQGDIVFVDAARPSEYVSSLGEEIDFVFPPSELQLPESALRDATATAFSTAEEGPAAAFVQLLRKLVTLKGAGGFVRRESTWVMARTAVQLIRAIVLEHMEASGKEHDRRNPPLIDSIDLYIDQHLADPDLTLQSIADAHYISIRHLHALFEPRETTVSVLIRMKRLERCVDMLVDPEFVNAPVVAIARRVGFTNMSHFGALFRQFTGMTPTQYRAAHAATVAALDGLDAPR